MKYFLLFFAAFILKSTASQAQNKRHKIVFDISSADTADQSVVIRQVNNILKVSPQSKIEVVFHGKAIFALVKDKTSFQQKLDDLVINKQVVIAACNNTLLRFNIGASELIPTAIVVPVAMLELADKQEKGWSYIKSGQ